MMEVKTPFIKWKGTIGKEEVPFNQDKDGKLYSEASTSALVAAITYGVLTVVFILWVMWRNKRIGLSQEANNNFQSGGQYQVQHDESNNRLQD